MSWWSRLAGGFRALVRSRRAEQDLDEELRGFIAASAAARIRAGIPPKRAWREARIELGGMEAAKEHVRGAGWESAVDALWQDTRHGFRACLRTPGTTTTIVLALAVGIGLNTAAFSIVNAVFLRPLAVPNPSEVVYASGALGEAIDVETFRQRTGPTLSSITTHSRIRAVFSTEGRFDRLIGEMVAANYFDTLQVRAAFGRTFGPAEDQTSNPDPAVIISHDLWTRRLSRDREVIGTRVRIDGKGFTIVGVTPAGFGGVSAPWEPSQFWVTTAQYIDDPDLARKVAGRSDSLIARLAPGVSLRQARALAASQTSQSTEGRKQDRYLIRASADVLLPTEVTNNESGPVLALVSVISTIAGIVLLIATINTMGLLLARGVTRRPELAVRQALGAGTWRVVRQLVTESLLLAGAAGLAGLLVAALLLSLYRAFSPASVLALNVTLDFRVLCFAAAVSLTAGIAAGLAPAWATRKINVLASLTGGARAGTSRSTRRHLRYGVVLPQIALALVLLVVAGSLLRPILRTEFAEPGFRVDDVVTMHLDYQAPESPTGARPPTDTEQADHRRGFYRRVAEELRGVPGNLAVSLASRLPTTASGPSVVVGRDSYSAHEPRTAKASRAMVSGHYFRTLDIGLIGGRDFDDHDVPSAPRVAIISESLARSLWPAAGALGQSIAVLPRGLQAPLDAEPQWLEVVGIVRDVRAAVDGREPPMLYTPVGQINMTWYPLMVVIHAVGDAGALNRLTNEAIRRAAPTAEVTDVTTMAQAIADRRYPRRAAAWLLGLSGLTGFLLATIGLYGVVSYSVAEQSRDMGIRAALGAGRRDIIRLVLRQTRTLLLTACALGFGLGYAALRVGSRFLGTLFDLPLAADGIAFIAVTSLVITVVLLACYIPARRAAATDPLDAIRSS